MNQIKRNMLTPDMNGDVSDSLFYLQSFYKEGHVVDKTDTLCVTLEGSLDNLLEVIKSVMPNCTVHKHKYNTVVISPDFGSLSFESRASHPGATTIDDWISTLTPQMHSEIFTAIQAMPKYKQPACEPNGSFYVRELFTDQLGATKSTNKMMSSSEMNEIRSDLFPGINVDKLVDSFLGSKENILIFVGKPGTGKTTFMKKVLQSMSLKMYGSSSVYTKDLKILNKPEFWAQTLPTSYCKFLVLDDLDKELTPRSEVKSNFVVNQLLSMSNGLFESTIKTIITTNLVDEGIDSALLRAGRCFDILNLPYLKADYAKNLWLTVDNRTEAEWETLFPVDDEEITQASYMANLESLQDQNPKDYLLDTSISARSRYSSAT